MARPALKTPGAGRARGELPRVAVSLRRALLLARRFRTAADATALARQLAAAAHARFDVARAVVLVAHEAQGEFVEVARAPDSAGAADGTRLRLPASRDRRDLAAAGAGGVTDLFVPATAFDPPLLLVATSPTETERPRGTGRAALQHLTDVAGHLLQERQLAAKVEQYRDDAEHDFLTGIYNRRLTMHLFEREIAKARRSGAPLALVMLDVDNFKSFNDRFGHLAGDEVLRSLARLVAQTARATDIVGRFGGEEFLVVLPETGIESAAIFAERLRQDVERFGRAELLQFRDGPPTVSIGVAAVGLEEDAEQAVAACDRALYESKHRGRNCFSLSLPAVHGLPEDDPR